MGDGSRLGTHTNVSTSRCAWVELVGSASMSHLVLQPPPSPCPHRVDGGAAELTNGLVRLATAPHLALQPPPSPRVGGGAAELTDGLVTSASASRLGLQAPSPRPRRRVDGGAAAPTVRVTEDSLKNRGTSSIRISLGLGPAPEALFPATVGDCCLRASASSSRCFRNRRALSKDSPSARLRCLLCSTAASSST